VARQIPGAGRATRVAVRSRPHRGFDHAAGQSRRQHMRASIGIRYRVDWRQRRHSLLNVVHDPVSMRVRLIASVRAGRSSRSRARSLLSCIRGERRGASGRRRGRTAMECRPRSGAGDVRFGSFGTHRSRLHRAALHDRERFSTLAGLGGPRGNRSGGCRTINMSMISVVSALTASGRAIKG